MTEIQQPTPRSETPEPTPRAQAPAPTPRSGTPEPRPRTPAPAPRSEPNSESLHRDTEGSVLPHDEHGKLNLRLQQALSGFVDEPRPAVEEADALLNDLVVRVGEILGERRSALRASWQDSTGESATEDLRTALRDYRALTERLLRL